LTTRKTALEEAIRHQVFSLSDIADAVRFRGDAESGLTDATNKDKRRWVEMLKVKAQVTPTLLSVVTCACLSKRV
jgi:hypothetical protein